MEHVVKKGYESEIWKYGFWTETSQQDYFNLKDHIKLSDYNDSVVVNHQANDQKESDETIVANILLDLYTNKTKESIELKSQKKSKKIERQPKSVSKDIQLNPFTIANEMDINKSKISDNKISENENIQKKNFWCLLI